MQKKTLMLENIRNGGGVNLLQDSNRDKWSRSRQRQRQKQKPGGRASHICQMYRRYHAPSDQHQKEAKGTFLGRGKKSKYFPGMIDIPQKRMDPSAEPETSFSGLKKKEEVTSSKAQITNLKNQGDWSHYQYQRGGHESSGHRQKTHWRTWLRGHNQGLQSDLKYVSENSFDQFFLNFSDATQRLLRIRRDRSLQEETRKIKCFLINWIE